MVKPCPYPDAFPHVFILRGINGLGNGMVIGIALIIAIAVVRYVTTVAGKTGGTIVTKVVISAITALPIPAGRPWAAMSAR